jgi:hypothetical protein
LRELLQGNTLARGAKKDEWDAAEAQQKAEEHAYKQTKSNPLAEEVLRAQMRNQEEQRRIEWARLAADKAQAQAAAAAKGSGAAAPPAPGSAQWKNATTQLEKWKTQKRGSTADLQDLKAFDALVDEVAKHPGLNIGVGLTSHISGATEAGRNFNALVKQLKVKGGFEAMSALRQSGGSLGSVTQGEHDMLQQILASLETAQTKEQFLSELGKMKAWVARNKLNTDALLKEVEPDIQSTSNFLRSGSQGAAQGSAPGASLEALAAALAGD